MPSSLHKRTTWISPHFPLEHAHFQSTSLKGTQQRCWLSSQAWPHIFCFIAMSKQEGHSSWQATSLYWMCKEKKERHKNLHSCIPYNVGTIQQECSTHSEHISSSTKGREFLRFHQCNHWGRAQDRRIQVQPWWYTTWPIRALLYHQTSPAHWRSTQGEKTMVCSASSRATGKAEKPPPLAAAFADSQYIQLLVP